MLRDIKGGGGHGDLPLSLGSSPGTTTTALPFYDPGQNRLTI